jgi:hypothetical protein
MGELVMKSFNLLAAIVILSWGSIVWADEPAPAEDASPAPVEESGTLDDQYTPSIADGAYGDFPGYDPGYTSYRGLGYMGSCCEQNSCCAQHVWDGYCAQKRCGHHGPFHDWADKFRCYWTQPACCSKGCCQQECCEATCSQKTICEDTCSQKTGWNAKPWHSFGHKLHDCWTRPACPPIKSGCCPEPCCDIKTKPWHSWLGKLHCGLHQPKCGVDACCELGCEQKGGKACGVDSKCPKPLCHKLHEFRARSGWGQGLGFRSYGEYYAPFDGTVVPMDTEPTPTDVDQPTPEATPDAALEPPADVTTDYVPTFPDTADDDRSAQRMDLRRLPDVF